MDESKRAAAEKALDYVHSGMALGLGTGSTIAHFLDLLGERLRSGTLDDIRGVPTSEHTAQRARELGIKLTTLTKTPHLDLAVQIK